MRVKCKCGAEGFIVVHHNNKPMWKVFFNNPGCDDCGLNDVNGEFYFNRYIGAGDDHLEEDGAYELNRMIDFNRCFTAEAVVEKKVDRIYLRGQ